MCWTHTTDEKMNLDRKDPQRFPSYFLRITKSYRIIISLHRDNNIASMDTLKSHDEEAIIITSLISIQPDCISAFLKIAKEVIEATRNEPGCIEYRFLQDPLCPEIFFFYEVYKNKEAQIFHSRQDYLNKFKKLREPMLQLQPVLKIYRATQC